MTPKEKAKELIELFKNFAESGYADSTSSILKTYEKNTKQCAIICCKEIINNYPDVLGTFPTEYWNEVITELEKL